MPKVTGQEKELFIGLITEIDAEERGLVGREAGYVFDADFRTKGTKQARKEKSDPEKTREKKGRCCARLASCPVLPRGYYLPTCRIAVCDSGRLPWDPLPADFLDSMTR